MARSYSSEESDTSQSTECPKALEAGNSRNRSAQQCGVGLQLIIFIQSH
jgi:hypothetical protein